MVMPGAEKKEGINHDELQEMAEKLVALLKERETGLFSWQTLLNGRLREFHDLLCPLFHAKDR